MANMNQDKKLIVGVGSALVDILAQVNDESLEKLGAPKGGMIYVDSEFIERVLPQISDKPSIVPGGSLAIPLSESVTSVERLVL